MHRSATRDCRLSPMLFNIFLKNIMSELNNVELRSRPTDYTVWPARKAPGDIRDITK